MHSDRPKLSMRHSLSDALRNGAELCQRSAAKTRVNCGRGDALQGTKGSPQRHPRARSICKGNHAPMHTVGRLSGYRRSGSWLLRQMVPGFCHRRFWASATDVVKPANALPSLASFFDVPRWGRSEKGQRVCAAAIGVLFSIGNPRQETRGVRFGNEKRAAHDGGQPFE